MNLMDHYRQYQEEIQRKLPQWHPGAQIRSGHPEDAAVQVDPNWKKRWEEMNDGR